ncbi:hypothetical protein STENM223S_04750 [Streptomyces tendae]
MTPATPAAAWVWPMLDFTEPSSSGRSAGRSCPYVARRACASMGSPRVVPVPCASTASTSAGGEPRLAQGLLDDALLGGPVGGGEAVGGAVLVDGGAADHGEHGVAVAAGVRQAFHQEQADALGPAGAVGAVGERLAAPVGGQAALPAELDEAGGGHDGDAAGQREVALAVAQRLHRPGAGRPGRRSRRCRR